MRRFAAAAVTVVAASSFVLASAVPAFGCSCVATTITGAVGPDTAAAFVGTAVSVTEVGYPEELPIEEQEAGTQQVEEPLREDDQRQAENLDDGPDDPVHDPEDGGDGPDWWAPLRWTFEVETVLVGDVPQTVEVGAGYGDGDCGYDFADAGRVGVVAGVDDLGLATSICGGIWDADELIAAYGPGTDPADVAVSAGSGSADSGPSAWIWVGLAAAAILTGVGLAIFRSRQSP